MAETINKPKRKVLIVASVFFHIAAFHIPFIRHLQQKGYEVHAAANSSGGEKKVVEATGAVCWEIPFERSPFKTGNVFAFGQLQQLFRRHQFDLIHVHTPVASFITRFLAKKMQQGPLLYTAHGFHFFKGAPLINWIIYRSAEFIAKRWTDGIIVINHEDYNSAQKLGYIPNEDLYYVPGVGIEINVDKNISLERKGIREELCIPLHAPIVTCVAELNNNKNQIFLLEAWKNVEKDIPQAILLLVGTGEYLNKIRGYIESNKLRRVYLLDYRTDVPRIMEESDVVTLVSKREGLPKSLMEAMASKKPLIVSNVRGSRDLVDEGVTGYIVSLGDVEGLKNALKKLLTNTLLCKQMGHLGFKKVQGFSMETVLNELNKVYQKYLR